jgi:hypothetical protein
MKHNYPKIRKANPESQTQRLLAALGEQELYKIWSSLGMYKASDKIHEIIGWYPSNSIINYLSVLFGWKRIVTDKSLPIYQSVLSGKVPAEHFKHIIFA